MWLIISMYITNSKQGDTNMLEALNPLIESGLLSESTQQAINEAWQNKLNETKSEIRVEVRNEFAERYEHDKKLMVESLDRMVTETLSEEIQKVKEDRQAAAQDRVKAVRRHKAIGEAFKKFLVKSLTNEIREFRADKAKQKLAVEQLETFIMKQLAEEIAEFAEDKKALVETKVRLVKNANSKLQELKKQFISRSSKAVQETVSKTLKSELSQLRNDITEAKKNSFGRKMFETFADEFAASYLNEKAEYRKLKQTIAEKDAKIVEATQMVKKAQTIIENKDRSLKNVADNSKREKIMNELLAPLNKEKGALMSQLLENTQTDKLQDAFDKYLPSVLDSSKTAKTVLKENKSEVTGDKPVKNNDVEGNIIEIKRLAGL